jgi:hypothetical protein
MKPGKLNVVLLPAMVTAGVALPLAVKALSKRKSVFELLSIT